MNEKILIAEDDPAILAGVRDLLEIEGYSVEEAVDGVAALEAFRNQRPDLVLLDVMMPKMSGYEVCRTIRQENHFIPILMLTAKGEEIDKVIGLELGADDYIVKPFDMKEVLARIKAVIRRFQNNDAPDKELVFPGLTINISNYSVSYMGHALELPPKEMELLYFLASHQNKVFTREQLLEQVWGYDYFGDSRTVDVHIKRLREKLSVGEDMGWSLKTVWGVGYKFEVK